MRARREICAAAIAAGCALLAGCGGASPGGAPGSLRQTLGAVRYASGMDGTFEYGDVAAERKLAGVSIGYRLAGHANSTWIQLLGVGASYFMEDPTGRVDGLDSYAASSALTIGQPPRQAAIITGPGLDTAATRRDLVKLGAAPGTVLGRRGLIWGQQGSLHLGGANSFGIGPAEGEFDRAVIASHRVAASRFNASLATVLGGGHTLAGDPVFEATFTCLGDVIAATGTALRDSTGHTDELSAGVLRPTSAAAPVREVECAVVPAADIGSVAGSMRAQLTPRAADQTVDLVPPADLAGPASVTTGVSNGKHWARAVITDRNGVPAGSLVRGVARVAGRAGVQTPTP